jgi:integrase
MRGSGNEWGGHGYTRQAGEKNTPFILTRCIGSSGQIAAIPLRSLRHTHTSHLLASGVPLTAASARLGHGSTNNTGEDLLSYDSGQDDEAARKWEEFQNNASGGALQPKGQAQ